MSFTKFNSLKLQKNLTLTIHRLELSHQFIEKVVDGPANYSLTSLKNFSMVREDTSQSPKSQPMATRE